jgi:hypothetical protein
METVPGMRYGVAVDTDHADATVVFQTTEALATSGHAGHVAVDVLMIAIVVPVLATPETVNWTFC